MNEAVRAGALRRAEKNAGGSLNLKSPIDIRNFSDKTIMTTAVGSPTARHSASSRSLDFHDRLTASRGESR